MITLPEPGPNSDSSEEQARDSSGQDGGVRHPSFSVDTQLFRELGELLVGRDSTALVELIKNAYDADATEVVVYGEALADPVHGHIIITDNGTGMSREEFELDFLRIASRSKSTATRRSSMFQRRFTGEKGIGRLAAHKLSRFVEINSLRWDNSAARSVALSAKSAVSATIDWELVESYPTLESLRGTNAITVVEPTLELPTSPGTTITLRKLRGNWTRSAHSRFLEELQAFGAAPVLSERLPKTVARDPLLFDVPRIRDSADSRGAQFIVKLEGDLAPADDYWQAKAEAATWVLEIDSLSDTNRVRYCVAPTGPPDLATPLAKREESSIPHPSPTTGPFFQARILLRTGRAWEGRIGGIRVFVEGFRLLPYGEPRNDWLALDRDATERSGGRFQNVDQEGAITDSSMGGAGGLNDSLLILPNKHYFGAVFLTQEGSGALRTLVNREGFVPDVSYEHLTNLVRRGIDILTRSRAAATEGEREKRRNERAQRRDQSATATAALRRAIGEASVAARDARRLIAAGSLAAAGERLDEALKQMEGVESASQEMIGHAAMLRVLASVGTQMAAFVHEINGLVGTAESVDHALRRLRRMRGKSRQAEQDELLVSLVRVVGDLRRNLERQASYLVDVVTPDARRRRTRLQFSERFDAAARLVSHPAELAGVKIENGIPATLKSPPMFPAELTTVFSNLLTNAVKAAGKNGRVRATGKRASSMVELRIENTGVAVHPSKGERWFRPFESTTASVDAVLGQGMGLGLSITRSVLAEYGATIRFAEPRPGFSTALELLIPV